MTLHEGEWWTLLAAVLCGIACAVPGCFLVLRKMSMLGDAISHAILPGLAAAFLLTGTRDLLPMLIGAGIAGLATAVLSAWITRMGNVPEDAAMGVVFSTLFALGVVMISLAARNVDLDPGCVLYGEIAMTPFTRVELLGASIPRAVMILGSAAIINSVLAAVFFKELKLASFDGALATSLGFSAALIHYCLMGVVASTTVVSFESVGSVLVVAMLIGPAASAHMLTDRLSRMLWLSVILAAAAAGAGYHAALYWNVAAAGMMSVAVGVEFALCIFLAPREGVVAKLVRRLRLSQRIAREDALGMLFRSGEVRPGSALPSGTVRGGIGGGLRARIAVWGLSRTKRVSSHADGMRLTAAGESDARKLVRSHRLWESFLAKYLGLPVDHVHEPSERMEHYITPELREGINAELRTGLDPQGKRIPEEGE